MMLREKIKNAAAGIAHTAWKGAKVLRPRHVPRTFVFSRRTRRRLHTYRQVRRRAQGRQKILSRVIRFSGGIFHPCRFKLRSFSTHVPLHIQRNNYLIKTAETPKEVEQLLRLRYTVFYAEYLQRRKFLRIDVDAYDTMCDHLMVIDTENSVCVGTYRVLCSKFVNEYYSSTEFHIDPIVALPGTKIELGRACVHRSYRSSIVLALLWRGLSEYTAQTQTRFLFGCSSVKTTDPQEAAIAYVYLMSLYAAPEHLRVTPTDLFRIENFQKYVDIARAMDHDECMRLGEALVPPLLHSYLKAGGYVCGEPALDIDFKCADFFTLMDMHKLSGNMQKKYA